MRAIPLDPRQALAVRAERRRRIKISAFGQYVARPRSGVKADQTMPVVVFFDRQHLPMGKLHIAIAAVALGQGVRRSALQCLHIHLLIGLVDEHHAVIAQAKRPAAVLIHTTAHAEAVGRQAVRLTVAPVPEAAGRVLGAIFVPEQAVAAEFQFGKIHPGGHGEGGAERFSLWR